MIWWCIRYHLLTRCCFDAILLIHNKRKEIRHVKWLEPFWNYAFRLRLTEMEGIHQKIAHTFFKVRIKLKWKNKSLHFFLHLHANTKKRILFFWWRASRANNRIHLTTADIKAVYFSPIDYIEHEHRARQRQQQISD